jgi:hypothetical protein
MDVIEPLREITLRAMCHGRNNGSIIVSNISVLSHLSPQNFIKLGLEMEMPLCCRRQD